MYDKREVYAAKMGDTMFGYVRVYQPELKMGEFEQYRGLYCSLCRYLGKHYGMLAQMTLSYDMTFLTVLHMSLSDQCPGFKEGRCPYNPFKKCRFCGEHAALAFCADAAMLLLYYKTQDSVADDRWLKRWLSRILLIRVRRYHRKAAARLPELDALMKREMAHQQQLEAVCTASLDAAAEPTARMLAALCAAASRNEAQCEVLERLGYCLGRWVYLMDATDDLEDDLKRGGYNPILLTHKPSDTAHIEAVRQKMRLSLNASLAECAAAYDALTVHRFDGILHNIIGDGLRHIQQQVLSADTKKRLTDKQEV